MIARYSDEVALRSSLLERHGFAHAFSLRTGGVSAAPFDSLNLGRSVGDDPRAVSENLARFLAAVDAKDVFEVSQVHGREVVIVDEGDEVLATRAREADALVTRIRGACVGVRTADCAPILIADPERGAVAAVHAGWRGVVARVIDAALDRMIALGASAGELVVAIGPHIRADAFEVGDDVAAQIAREAHGEDVVLRGAERPRVDLAKTIRAQLSRRGVRDENVDDVGGCTFTEPSRFFSHRRDAGRTGRHLAVIRAR